VDDGLRAYAPRHRRCRGARGRCAEGLRQGRQDRAEPELDRDPEEQAIEVEQEDVPITMEDNLRAELEQIEERLQRLGEND